MLNFDTPPKTSAKQTKTTQVRHDEQLANLIERAARALAIEKSTFVRYAIKLEAMRVLEFQSRHELTPEDARVFAAALDSPPSPTLRALEAARSYRERVVHAD